MYIMCLCVCVGVVFSTRPEDVDIQCMESTVANYLKVYYIILYMYVHVHIHIYNVHTCIHSIFNER